MARSIPLKRSKTRMRSSFLPRFALDDTAAVNERTVANMPRCSGCAAATLWAEGARIVSSSAPFDDGRCPPVASSLDVKPRRDLIQRRVLRRRRGLEIVERVDISRVCGAARTAVPLWLSSSRSRQRGEYAALPLFIYDQRFARRTRPRLLLETLPGGCRPITAVEDRATARSSRGGLASWSDHRRTVCFSVWQLVLAARRDAFVGRRPRAVRSCRRSSAGALPARRRRGSAHQQALQIAGRCSAASSCSRHAPRVLRGRAVFLIAAALFALTRSPRQPARNWRSNCSRNFAPVLAVSEHSGAAVDPPSAYRRCSC